MNIEAEQADTLDNESDDWDDDDDDDDDEATTAERARQAAESVPLRRRDQVNEVLQVAKKWEEYAKQGELAMQRKPRQKKRTRKADPPAIPRSQKRARTGNKNPSPPPNTFPVEVATCNGIIVIHLPEIPGETEFDHEMRIYDASDPIIRAAELQEIATILSRQGPAPATSSVSTPPAASSPTVTDEWAGGALTPTIASTPPPRSSPASLAPSLSPLLEDFPDGAATPVACSRSPSQAPPALLPLFLPDNWSDGSTPAPSPPSDVEMDL